MGDTGVGEPDEARKEHAMSDRRRVRGTIRAAFMDNGAPHLESYRRLPQRLQFRGP